MIPLWVRHSMCFNKAHVINTLTYSWPCAWIELLEALTAILTLGFLRPPWSLRFSVWNIDRQIARARRK